MTLSSFVRQSVRNMACGAVPMKGKSETLPQKVTDLNRSLPNPSSSHLYDIALSFAGEDRTYAEALAAALIRRGVLVFYDSYEKATLWGKDLYTYLADLYQNQARFCVMLLSQRYAQKLW